MQDEIISKGTLPPEVTTVEPLDDWKLHLTFANGEERISATGIPKTEIIRRALDDYLWDKQIENDLNTGRPNGILAKAKKQSEQGKSTPL